MNLTTVPVCRQKKINLNLCVRAQRNEFWHHCARIHIVKNGICTQAWKHVSQLSPSLRCGGGGGGGGVGTILDDQGISFSGNSCRQEEQFVIDRHAARQSERRNYIFLVGQVLLFSWDKKRSVCAEVDRKVLYLSAERLFCSWHMTGEFYSSLDLSTEWSSALEWTGDFFASQRTGRSCAYQSAEQKTCSWQ